MNPYLKAMEKQAALMELLTHGVHLAGQLATPGAGMRMAGAGGVAHAVGMGAAKLSTKTVPHVGKLGDLGKSPILREASRLTTVGHHSGDSLANIVIGGLT